MKNRVVWPGPNGYHLDGQIKTSIVMYFERCLHTVFVISFQFSFTTLCNKILFMQSLACLYTKFYILITNMTSDWQ